MAYRLRVYAPATGVRRLTIRISGTTYTGDPAGSSTPAWDSQSDYGSNLTVDATISATAASGYTISNCIVNIDGAVHEFANTDSYTQTYSSTFSQVYVRFEVEEEEVPTEYSATIYYDANGGTGAPSSQTGYTTNDDQYVTMYLSSREPTRDGYVFEGWDLVQLSGTQYYQPGERVTLWGSEQGEEYDMVAQWSEAQADGRVWIYYNGRWRSAIPYVYRGGWQQAIPYVYEGGWNKCV